MAEPITAERLAELRADAMTLRMRVGPPVPEEMWDELARMAEEAGCNADSIRRRQRDFMSLTHATIGAAFQVGWRQGTAGVPELLAEVERLRGELATAKTQAETGLGIFLSVEKVLTDALGPDEEDGTGDGTAADVALVVHQRDEARAELAKAREAVRTRFTDHYLAQIVCDHENGTDNPICACSRVFLGWYPSVGDAVSAWVDHVLGPAAPSAVEAAGTVPADAVTALRDAGILACRPDQTGEGVRKGEVAS